MVYEVYGDFVLNENSRTMDIRINKTLKNNEILDSVVTFEIVLLTDKELTLKSRDFVTHYFRN